MGSNPSTCILAVCSKTTCTIDSYHRWLDPQLGSGALRRLGWAQRFSCCASLTHVIWTLRPSIQTKIAPGKCRFWLEIDPIKLQIGFYFIHTSILNQEPSICKKAPLHQICDFHHTRLDELKSELWAHHCINLAYLRPPIQVELQNSMLSSSYSHFHVISNLKIVISMLFWPIQASIHKFETSKEMYEAWDIGMVHQIVKRGWKSKSQFWYFLLLSDISLFDCMMLDTCVITLVKLELKKILTFEHNTSKIPLARRWHKRKR